LRLSDNPLGIEAARLLAQSSLQLRGPWLRGFDLGEGEELLRERFGDALEVESLKYVG
jgi:hypothetical protein